MNSHITETLALSRHFYLLLPIGFNSPALLLRLNKKITPWDNWHISHIHLQAFTHSLTQRGVEGMLLHNGYERSNDTFCVYNASLLLLLDHPPSLNIQWDRQIVEMMIGYQLKPVCYNSLLEKENHVAVTSLLSSGISRWITQSCSWGENLCFRKSTPNCWKYSKDTLLQWTCFSSIKLIIFLPQKSKQAALELPKAILWEQWTFERLLGSWNIQ